MGTRLNKQEDLNPHIQTYIIFYQMTCKSVVVQMSCYEIHVTHPLGCDLNVHGSLAQEAVQIDMSRAGGDTPRGTKTKFPPGQAINHAYPLL